MTLKIIMTLYEFLAVDSFVGTL